MKTARKKNQANDNTHQHLIYRFFGNTKKNLRLARVE